MLQLIKNTPDFTVAHYNSQVVFIVWKRRIDPKGVDIVQKAQEQMLKMTGKKLFIITVTIRGCDLPKDDGLIRISDWLGETGTHYNASAVVHFDTGWRAAVVKAVTWAIVKSAKAPIPHEPFFSYVAAIAWFCKRWPESGLVCDDVRDAFEELMEAVGDEMSQ